MQRAEAFLAVVLVTAWPVVLPMSLYVVATPSKHSREERLECMIILESLVYALIALGISYAVLLTV